MVCMENGHWTSFLANIIPPLDMQYPQDAAVKREITSVKFQKWEAGKPVGAKF